jgi:hypothetical protein
MGLWLPWWAWHTVRLRHSAWGAEARLAWGSCGLEGLYVVYGCARCEASGNPAVVLVSAWSEHLYEGADGQQMAPVRVEDLTVSSPGLADVRWGGAK